jgi:diguanylate cyclase (GGDEF)-like protein
MKGRTLIFFLLLGLTARAISADETGNLKRQLSRAAGTERAVVARKLVAALVAEGDSRQKKHENKESLAPYLEALAIQEKELGAPPSAHLLNRIGLAELILGNYDKSLAHLLRSLAIAEKNSERAYITRGNYLIGYVHRDLRNYETALEYFTAAHRSALAAGDPYYAILALNEIGNVHVYAERFAEAVPFKERSLKMAREFADRQLLANCLHDMGHLYLMQDRPAQALPYFQEALAIIRSAGGDREIIIVLINTADAYRRLKRFAAGLACLDEALALTERSGLQKLMSDILETYSRIHEGMGNYQQALDYQRRFQDYRERMLNEEKVKQTAEMQARYDVEKKQRENELLKREKQIAALALDKQRNQRNFLFFLALLVMLLAVLLYSRFRVKARAHRTLEAANRQIVAQQDKLEEAYRQMADLARQDHLTGLPNRRMAIEAIDREEKRFQRNQKPFVLVMTDIDGFKAVNDQVGHDAGDYVLRSLAALFSQSLRSQDMVFRWGGDEFLFLLPETAHDGAQVFMAAVKKKVRDSDLEFNGRRLQVAASMGACVFDGGTSVEACLRHADQEMYRSRKS